MPTPTRREFVWRRARNEFEASRRLDSAAEIRDALQLAGTQLQTLEVQGPHLTKLQAAMPDRFESADDAVGLMYADTTGTRPTRTQISAAVRQHALRATRASRTRALRLQSAQRLFTHLHVSCPCLQARDLEAELKRLSRRVARMERSDAAMREEIASQDVTISAEMRADLEAQQVALLAAQEQLASLQAEVEEKQRRKAAAEAEEAAAAAAAAAAPPLRASPDPAEQTRLEEL
jgi:hypothetical protein